VWWNHDDKERKAAPRGQSLFKLLIFSSLLLRTLHGDGRAATVRDCETNSHHRPPHACQGWMDGWIERMNGWVNEWMDELDRWMGGWMHECMDGRRVDGQEVTLFSIRFPIPLGQT
jgi:hypothetical protein